MGQMGFFDISKRYAGLDAKNDPLVKIDEVVGWADFRPRLDAVWRKSAEERKSPAGRKPWDAVVMFKAIVLCELYNLSDDQVDRRHKLVRRYRVTDAAVHDSQVVEDILDPDNTASDVWADSAYRSAEIEAKLEDKGLKSRIHRKGHRDKPLSEREKRGNKTRSRVRARVEHVFGAQSNDMGGTLVRGIGLVRARARIGLKNLAYNMRRLVQLERLASAAPT